MARGLGDVQKWILLLAQKRQAKREEREREHHDRHPGRKLPRSEPDVRVGDILEAAFDLPARPRKRDREPRRRALTTIARAKAGLVRRGLLSRDGTCLTTWGDLLAVDLTMATLSKEGTLGSYLANLPPILGKPQVPPKPRHRPVNR